MFKLKVAALLVILTSGLGAAEPTVRQTGSIEVALKLHAFAEMNIEDAGREVTLEVVTDCGDRGLVCIAGARPLTVSLLGNTVVELQVVPERGMYRNGRKLGYLSSRSGQPTTSPLYFDVILERVDMPFVPPSGAEQTAQSPVGGDALAPMANWRESIDLRHGPKLVRLHVRLVPDPANTTGIVATGLYVAPFNLSITTF
ncbi:hypothetical protein KUW09_24790 [Mameliella alba]|nr:hypothetical protein [Antarctobacter heliothermus]MBY6147289.1 hypothetical protein [Mameliella alba]MCA0957355.1 hypothetical protein [Mameliella alba]